MFEARSRCLVVWSPIQQWDSFEYPSVNGSMTINAHWVSLGIIMYHLYSKVLTMEHMNFHEIRVTFFWIPPSWRAILVCCIRPLPGNFVYQASISSASPPTDLHNRSLRSLNISVETVAHCGTVIFQNEVFNYGAWTPDSHGECWNSSHFCLEKGWFSAKGLPRKLLMPNLGTQMYPAIISIKRSASNQLGMSLPWCQKREPIQMDLPWFTYQKPIKNIQSINFIQYFSGSSGLPPWSMAPGHTCSS